MNTNFGKFKTLELRIIAGDLIKVGVNEPTSIFSGFFMTFCTCVSLYNGIKHCVEH